MVAEMDNFIKHKYGEFKEYQVRDYQRKLRKKIYWLVLYTDKATRDDFRDVNVVRCHENLMFEISRYNELLFYPKNFVEIISNLESALYILKSGHFNFQKYKHFVLHAGALLDELEAGE